MGIERLELKVEWNRVWSRSSFVTECKGVAVAAHCCFIAPQLLLLDPVAHPTTHPMHKVAICFTPCAFELTIVIVKLH